MTNESFLKLIKEDFLPDCFNIMSSKGMAYSGLEDKLGNFKRVAKLANVPVATVWFVYFCKHFDSVCSYIRGEYSDSEPLEGRLRDITNYAFLLYAILVEEGKIKTGGK